MVRTILKDTKQRAIELYAKGLNKAQIALRLGIGETSVSRFVTPGYAERRRELGRSAEPNRTPGKRTPPPITLPSLPTPRS